MALIMLLKQYHFNDHVCQKNLLRPILFLDIYFSPQDHIDFFFYFSNDQYKVLYFIISSYQHHKYQVQTHHYYHCLAFFSSQI